jgi:hypothetical protein
LLTSLQLQGASGLALELISPQLDGISDPNARFKFASILFNTMHIRGRYADAAVERLASDVIELSTRHQFASWLAAGKVFRGWALSASGDTVLHRLKSVFLAAMGAEQNQIEASFGEAIRIAKEQKSVSLEKRAEATYAEYRRQKASVSGGRGVRLPLC